MVYNIIWKLPDNSVAITSVLLNVDSQQHSIDLKTQGSVPADWEAVAFDYLGPFPDSRLSLAYLWDEESASITINLPPARELVKTVLRRKRLPLISALDIEFQRNLETGADNSAVIAEKQRLRDITDFVDDLTTEEELLNALTMEI